MSQLLNQDTATQQSRLTTYCRTGEEQELIGVTANRVQHYRRLIYNIADDTLRTAYPLTYNLLEEQKWYELVDDFFSHHKCQSYKVWEMPLELYEYVSRNKHNLHGRYPFINELLWFEWLEVKLFMMEDIAPEEYSTVGDYVKDVPVFNPEYTIEKFEYPVHKKNAKHITSEDVNTYYVLMYRDKEGKVQFLDISTFFAWLIETIHNNNVSVEDLSETAAVTFNIDVNDVAKHGRHFLQALHTKGFLLGFKK